MAKTVHLVPSDAPGILSWKPPDAALLQLEAGKRNRLFGVAELVNWLT